MKIHEETLTCSRRYTRLCQGALAGKKLSRFDMFF